MRLVLALAALLPFAQCDDDNTASEEIVRGVKTHLVEETERVTVRRFPSVLEPASLNTVSFEIGGKLGEVTLAVGQRVARGDVLATLDEASLLIQVENAEAGIEVAQVAADNAAETLARQEELLARGSTTKVNVDNARTDASIKAAQLAQAIASLESAKNNLEKAVITAPFDGILNSVDIQSFATVAAGTPVVSLYSASSFEVSFSANYDTISELVVGKPAKVRLADRPDVVLTAVVSELGSRADSVSSFPIVLALLESDPILKAGMAVEASIEFPLPAAQGFVIPLSAVIKEGDIGNGGDNARDPSPAAVYVYDDATSTVKKTDVVVGGVRENLLVIIGGLEPGDRVASAGVSFLRDGQAVKLLSEDR